MFKQEELIKHNLKRILLKDIISLHDMLGLLEK